MKNIVVFPGSFDPLTLGHVNIVQRGLKIFNSVIVAVATNISKKSLFNEEERVSLLKEVFRKMPRVKVDTFEGLLVNYLKRIGASVILKGLRIGEDFEYERQMALANKSLEKGIETVFMMSDPKYLYFSSSLIKEIVMLGGSVRTMVPAAVERKLREKLRDKKEDLKNADFAR